MSLEITRVTLKEFKLTREDFIKMLQDYIKNITGSDEEISSYEALEIQQGSQSIYVKSPTSGTTEDPISIRTKIINNGWTKKEQ